MSTRVQEQEVTGNGGLGKRGCLRPELRVLFGKAEDWSGEL